MEINELLTNLGTSIALYLVLSSWHSQCEMGTRHVDIALNTTDISDDYLVVEWSIGKGDHVNITDLRVSLTSVNDDDLHQSVILKNASVDRHCFTGLQSSSTYNACLSVYTSVENKPGVMHNCIMAQTLPSTLSRLQVFGSSTEDSDLTAFWCLLSIVLFIVLVVVCYNLYWKAFVTRQLATLRPSPARSYMRVGNEFDASHSEVLPGSQRTEPIPIRSRYRSGTDDGSFRFEEFETSLTEPLI